MSDDHPLPRRIDVHSHFLPPDYSHALATNGHEKVDGMPGIPPWTLEDHLSMMETANISKSILSISSPGTHIVPGKDELGRNLTRHCNSYAADLKRKYPDKFGFWAALPLPDVDAALKEIDIAIDEGANGFGLMTNYHGRYLGSSHLDPVFEKLNRVGATVFIHPTKPCIHHHGSSGASNEETSDALPLGDQFPIPVFEFLFDTARAVINLFVSGTVAKYPNITYIIPHVGGCLPPLWTRFVQFSHVVPGGTKIDVRDARRTLETRFFFDLAGFIFDNSDTGHGQLKSFVEGLQISHNRLLYGSDFPFTRANFVKEFADKMKSGLETLFSQDEREAIYAGNAARLLGTKKMHKHNL